MCWGVQRSQGKKKTQNFSLDTFAVSNASNRADPAIKRCKDYEHFIQT